MDKTNNDIPEEFSLYLFPSRIRARLGHNVLKVLLFGSQARGSAHEDSDIDYCIVLDNTFPIKEAHEIIDDEAGRLLVEQGCVISAFAVKESDFMRYIYNPLFINIRREGIAV